MYTGLRSEILFTIPQSPSMVMEMSTDTLFHTAIEALVDIAIIIETSMSESQKVRDYE